MKSILVVISVILNYSVLFQIRSLCDLNNVLRFQLCKLVNE